MNFRRVVTAKSIREGCLIPRGYGVAYREWDASVCFPLPFNWLVRWVLAAYYWLDCPTGSLRYERDHFAAYAAGRRRGLHDAVRAILNPPVSGPK